LRPSERSPRIPQELTGEFASKVAFMAAYPLRASIFGMATGRVLPTQIFAMVREGVLLAEREDRDR
jgi:hypothetical protein